jgi:hypothetical protein
MMDYLREHAAPDETLLVVPEGAAINFLTGLRNPTPFNHFIPPEFETPGAEERMVEKIREAQVDRILLIDRNVREYGYRGPGIDYAMKLTELILRDYVVEATSGDPPFANPRGEGGAILFRLRESE